MRVQDETVWLSLHQVAEFSLRDKSVISRHIKNVFNEGERRREAINATVYGQTEAEVVYARRFT